MPERISSPGRTREIIEKYSFNFKKGFGQNFLIDYNILKAIVREAGVTKDDFVLEIGPGIGSLTEAIAEAAGRVLSVEIDPKLIPILEETLSHCDNAEVINSDILKTDIAGIIEEKNGGRPIKVVANLPYYITTPIIMELLERRLNISSITVMVQKEVAQRLQAEPGGKEYGAISVAVAYYCRAKTVLMVPPSCFMPRPKVDSAVLRLETLPEPSVSVPDEELFFTLVKAAFSQRRKTLLNCLANNGGLELSKEKLEELIESAGFDARIRGERLSCQDFARLCSIIYEYIHSAE